MGASAQNTFALKADVAAAGFVDTGQYVEYRGFTGAVGSDQAHDLTVADVKAQLGQSHQPAESYRDVVQL